MSDSIAADKISNTMPLTNITPLKNKTINILSIDQTAFPKIKVNVFIDKFCAMAGNVKKSDLAIRENGTDAAIDNFYFTGNASGQQLDLAVVFDDTGSMQPQIDAMKSKVKDLTDKIKASGIDANYSLISFKDRVSVKTSWTNDPAVFKNSVDSLLAIGGGDEPEVSLDAIEAVLSMGFRSNAQKVILVITDAQTHFYNDSTSFSKYTKEQVEKNLKESGVIFIPVSPTFDKTSNFVDLREVANDIQSTWINLNSANFSTILEQFQGMLTGSYVIEYTSPDQTPGKNRTVLVDVNAPGCVAGSDSSAYTSPGSPARPNSPPTIDDLTSDKTSPQEAGTTINWTANAIDPDGDLVLYKFFLDGQPMTPWAEDKTWMWEAERAGSYRIEVQVRDAKHAGPDGQDDLRAENFTINEPKAAALKNQPPIIDDLLAVQGNATAITWIANATDPENDPILHRFILNNKTVTNWIKENKWTLNTNDAKVGNNTIEVQIRDGKHISPEGYDDSKSIRFMLSSMRLMVHTWQRTIKDGRLTDGRLTIEKRVKSVQQTDDGGYIFAGTETYHSWNGNYKIIWNGESNTWLFKTDSLGKIIWERTYGLNDSSAASVWQTYDGGYIIAGGKGPLLGRDAMLIKTDSSGNEIWERVYGGNKAWSVQQANDGGYVVVGTTSSYGAGGDDIWLLKTDLSGSEEWNRIFGGFENDGANSVQQTNDGGYIIAGNTMSYGQGNSDAWLVKTDHFGNKEWDKTYGGSGFDQAFSVQQTKDGGYIIGGSTDSNGVGTGSAWLIKTDESGNEEWNKTFGDTGDDSAGCVKQTSDGGYVIGGSYNGYIWLVKTDNKGNAEWARTFGGSDWGEGYSAQQTSDGGYIIAGNAGLPIDGVLLVKTDSNGNA